MTFVLSGKFRQGDATLGRCFRVVSLLNYLFFSLQISPNFSGVFKHLHDRFWHTYLSHRSDEQLTAVIQPWFAWRALVVASPVWYPTIADDVRRKMLNFSRRVLITERYDYANVDQYLEAFK